MKKLVLLLMLTFYIATADSKNPEEIEEMRTDNNCYYIIKYTSGRKVSIFRNSPDLYIYSENSNETPLVDDKGRGIYDEFASLYKEWKAAKKRCASQQNREKQ